GARRRRARALEPVRGLPRGDRARRAAERVLHAAGRRLSVRCRRRHAGDHPVLRARRRGADPLPRAGAALEPRLAAAGAVRGGGGAVNNGIAVVVLSQGVLYGTPLLFAALGELLAERSGVLNLGVEGMMLVGAV